MQPNAHDDGRQAFAELQARLKQQYETLFPDPAAPRTIVIVPSLSMDAGVLAKIPGVHHYEERLLCLLMLLKYPAARIVYLSSEPISSTIIDYFLGLLPDVLAGEARERMTLLACHDATAQPLTAKILGRPRLLQRIADAMGDPTRAHMACFNVSNLERRLAVALGIPIYGCDPDLLHFGTKSGSRALFREAGLAMPDGFEDLRDERDVAEALTELKRRNAALKRAVVKLNEGFSGEGNAVFQFDHAPEGRPLHAWVREQLPRMEFAAEGMGWEEYAAKIAAMRAVTEAFIEGAEKRSPSAQYRINPLGRVEAISTHEQLLGGNAEQVFLGCRFPALEDDRVELQREGLAVARLLAAKGVMGRFGIDFIAVKEGETWRHYALEINLRKGGTTHPYIMLQYLTGGSYDASTGVFHAADGAPRHYRASDTIMNERYLGLTPRDLIDIAVANDIHFDRTRQEGVVFHLIGALSQFGKLGAVCIARSSDEADALYDRMLSALDAETGG